MPTTPMMLSANKDTPRQHKQRLERQVVYASILIQTVLSLLVVGFCVRELSRCPVNSADIDNGGTCPRALYTTILTGTIAYWFPSPYYAIISGVYGMTATDSGARSVKKKTSVEEGIEEDGNK
jgi:hypothetical protein